MQKTTVTSQRRDVGTEASCGHTIVADVPACDQTGLATIRQMMRSSIREQRRRRKRSSAARLRQMNLEHYGQPVLQASNIQYEMAVHGWNISNNDVRIGQARFPFASV